MEDSKTEKTARKFEGVMLALTIHDSKMISAAFKNIAGQYTDNCEEKELAEKISNRIDKQIEKRRIEGIEKLEQKVEQSVDAAIEHARQEDTAQMQSFDAAREEDAEAEKYAQENRVK